MFEESLRGEVLSAGRTVQHDIEGPRRLQQKNATEVQTAVELLQAIASGERDILITEHIDLTSLELIKTSICDVGCEGHLGEIQETRSLRV